VCAASGISLMTSGRSLERIGNRTVTDRRMDETITTDICCILI